MKITISGYQGEGKTTVAAHLALELQSRGYRVTIECMTPTVRNPPPNCPPP